MVVVVVVVVVVNVHDEYSHQHHQQHPANQNPSSSSSNFHFSNQLYQSPSPIFIFPFSSSQPTHSNSATSQPTHSSSTTSQPTHSNSTTFQPIHLHHHLSLLLPQSPQQVSEPIPSSLSKRCHDDAKTSTIVLFYAFHTAKHAWMGSLCRVLPLLSSAAPEVVFHEASLHEFVYLLANLSEHFNSNQHFCSLVFDSFFGVGQMEGRLAGRWVLVGGLVECRWVLVGSLVECRWSGGV